MTTYYKLARPDGWDFHTGKTINYRAAIGKEARHPSPNPSLGICSEGVLHASLNADHCFQGASIPCSMYEVTGTPMIANDPTKHGFTALFIVREIDPASHFRWRYADAAKPFHPFHDCQGQVDEAALALLRQWAAILESVRESVSESVWASVRASVRASVGESVSESVWASVRASVMALVGESVSESVWASVRASVWASVRASVWAYYGWIFAPVTAQWHETYLFQSAVDLWMRGLVPSFDGLHWRLHAGPNGAVVWEGKV